MIETDIELIHLWHKNIIKAQNINLDTGLELIFLFSCIDEKFSELFERKILDVSLDNIWTKNTYKDFSSCLEELNNFLNSWGKNLDELKLDSLIWVYDGKSFHFSHIWHASVILGNLRGNIIEITDKKEKLKDFSFISSGDIAQGETLILSTERLLDILAKDDIADGLGTKYLRTCSENISHIILQEQHEANIACVSLRKKYKDEWKNWPSTLQKCWYVCMKALDNDIVKKILGYIYHLRDTILQKQKHTVQIIFWLGMILSVVVIYLFVSTFFQMLSKTQDVSIYEEKLLQVQASVQKASQSTNDIDTYLVYIEEAEKLLAEVEAVKLFESDSNKLRLDISVLENQVNGIQSFIPDENTIQQTFPEKQTIIKLVWSSRKVYAVIKKWIIWPLSLWENPETFLFPWLSENETFIDATEVGNDIILQTSAGKVVAFSGGKRFSIVNVSGQDTWFESPLIQSYNQNLYVLSKNRDQIYMHKKQGNVYQAGIPYLSEQDSQSLKDSIKWIAIDGGIYILKNDGTMLKFFKNPDYRLESLVLNRLPRNYKNLIETSDTVDISVTTQYVYIHIWKSIFVFQPNTNRVTDVKSLKFIGQIQSQKSDIQAFYINNDGDISLADENGVYRVKFDIEDFGLVIR